MRFLIDECLSPKLSRALHGLGHDAVHPRDYGRLGQKDHEIQERCVDEDRILTHNAEDFRKLVGREPLHPGLLILETTDVSGSLAQLEAAISYIERAAQNERAEDYMINRVLEVSADLDIKTYRLPKL